MKSSSARVGGYKGRAKRMRMATKQTRHVGPQTEHLGRLHNIQYLRGIAALGVVAFHAALTAGVPFRMGAFGVDIFFVISGFLMVAITNVNSRQAPFLRDRIVRVVPLYWIATLVVYLADRRYTSGPDQLVSSLMFIPRGHSADAPWFFPVLNVGWTLNYEML